MLCKECGTKNDSHKFKKMNVRQKTNLRLEEPSDEFKTRSQYDLSSNPDVSSDVQVKDTTAGGEDRMPRWIKIIIKSNFVMMILVIMLVGIVDIPFTLDSTVLTVYIVVSLGMPVGLKNHTVQNALSAIFEMES